MNERVIVDIEEHVATVKLNRPEKQNALDMAMFEALSQAGRDLKKRREVRAVLLCAEGAHFCAGIDVGIFGGGGVDMSLLEPLDDSPANFFQHPAYVWKELDVPVVCALAGNTFGGGLQIALGADIRIAAPDAKLSIMEVKWGLIPDLAITTTLSGILPRDRAKGLTLTGRIVSGVEAQALGLVTAVHDDPLAAARELCTTIAGNSPDAVRAAKQLVDAGFDLPDAESLRLEADLQRSVMSRPNQAEAVQAQLQRRKAEFTDD